MTQGLIVAWPSAKIAVMGGEQAAKVLLQIEKASLAKTGEEITPEKEQELLNRIIDRYNKTNYSRVRSIAPLGR